MDKKLLAMLVCPVSKAPVQLAKDQREIICVASGLAYPVSDNIPVMLESEARVMSSEEKEMYRKATGEQHGL